MYQEILQGWNIVWVFGLSTLALMGLPAFVCGVSYGKTNYVGAWTMLAAGAIGALVVPLLASNLIHGDPMLIVSLGFVPIGASGVGLWLAGVLVAHNEHRVPAFLVAGSTFSAFAAPIVLLASH